MESESGAGGCSGVGGMEQGCDTNSYMSTNCFEQLVQCRRAPEVSPPHVQGDNANREGRTIRRTSPNRPYIAHGWP
ncbi:hypothetical protein GCM10027162_32080 [Streptomyces incanus]